MEKQTEIFYGEKWKKKILWLHERAHPPITGCELMWLCSELIIIFQAIWENLIWLSHPLTCQTVVYGVIPVCYSPIQSSICSHSDFPTSSE